MSDQSQKTVQIIEKVGVTLVTGLVLWLLNSIDGQLKEQNRQLQQLTTTSTVNVQRIDRLETDVRDLVVRIQVLESQ